MKETSRLLSNKISSSTQGDGMLINDIIESIESEYYAVALAGFCIFFEARIKLLAEETEKVSIYKAIEKMYNQNRISDDERKILLDFKEIRNNYIHHRNSYYFLESDNCFYALDEKDTSRFILDKIVPNIIKIL
jgi:hypothetical protein